jgi:hypothetical protein
MTSNSRLPIHMRATVPQNSAGLFSVTNGPGMMPWMVIAPTVSAITALGGMPVVRSGMKAVWASALFAASGPATPSIARRPNRDGSAA